MNKKPKLNGKWDSSETAKKWPEGIIVIINRTERGIRAFESIQTVMWFKPDWVESAHGYGTEPMEFMRLT